MNYVEKEKTINTVKTEVLVIGSGPAGIGAAVSAARLGMKTTIVEQLGALGGIATSGMMSHWTGDCNSRIYHEILKESANRNCGEQKGKITIDIDPEKLKLQYLEMLSDCGVEILLYTFACDVIVEANTLKGVIIENKSGRNGDHKMQPATLMFKVGGVDTENAVYLGSFESTYETAKGELQALAKKHLPYPAGHVLLYHSTLPGVVTCNMSNAINIDGTNTKDLVKAEIICRGQIDKIVDFLREFVPGYENCYLISTASLIGVRETRHFEGKYSITEDDILQSRVFDDWIVRGASFNFDIHNIDGSGFDKNGVQKEFPHIDGYTIPLGCFIPKNIKGLLLCGRNISGTHVAHSNFRVMPICVGMGEGCGAVAAYAGKFNTDYDNVDIDIIHKYLTDGALF